MFDTLRQSWRDLKKGKPGERFQQRYRRGHERHGGTVRKILIIGGGVLIILVGVFLLPAPGPGMLVVVIGAALTAQESLFVARMLDSAEVSLRRVVARFRRGREKRA